MIRLLERFFNDHRSFYVILAATVLLGILGGWSYAQIKIITDAYQSELGYSDSIPFQPG